MSQVSQTYREIYYSDAQNTTPLRISRFNVLLWIVGWIIFVLLLGWSILFLNEYYCQENQRDKEQKNSNIKLDDIDHKDLLTGLMILFADFILLFILLLTFRIVLGNTSICCSFCYQSCCFQSRHNQSSYNHSRYDNIL